MTNKEEIVKLKKRINNLRFDLFLSLVVVCILLIVSIFFIEENKNDISDLNAQVDNINYLPDGYVEECADSYIIQHEQIKEYYFRVYKLDNNETLEDFWAQDLSSGIQQSQLSRRFYTQFEQSAIMVEYKPSKIEVYNETVCVKKNLVKYE